jgi:hypothetical protein
MMAGPRRELAIVHGPQFPTHRLGRHGDFKLLEHPLAEEHGGAQFLFAPVYAAWGKPIPDEWLRPKSAQTADIVGSDG